MFLFIQETRPFKFVQEMHPEVPWLFPIQNMWKSGYSKCAYIYVCREDELTYWTFFNGCQGHILVSETHPYSWFLVFHGGLFLPPFFMLSHLPQALVLELLKFMPCQNLLIARISFGCPTNLFTYFQAYVSSAQIQCCFTFMFQSMGMDGILIFIYFAKGFLQMWHCFVQ